MSKEKKAMLLCCKEGLIVFKKFARSSQGKGR